MQNTNRFIICLSLCVSAPTHSLSFCLSVCLSVFLCVSLPNSLMCEGGVSMCIQAFQVLRDRRAFEAPGTGVTGSWELSNVGVLIL